jgi:hypothetical protein
MRSLQRHADLSKPAVRGVWRLVPLFGPIHLLQRGGAECGLPLDPVNRSRRVLCHADGPADMLEQYLEHRVQHRCRLQGTRGQCRLCPGQIPRVDATTMRSVSLLRHPRDTRVGFAPGVPTTQQSRYEECAADCWVSNPRRRSIGGRRATPGAPRRRTLTLREDRVNTSGWSASWTSPSRGAVPAPGQKSTNGYQKRLRACMSWRLPA